MPTQPTYRAHAIAAGIFFVIATGYLAFRLFKAIMFATIAVQRMLILAMTEAHPAAGGSGNGTGAVADHQRLPPRGSGPSARLNLFFVQHPIGGHLRV
jgi:hypothetical protein